LFLTWPYHCPKPHSESSKSINIQRIVIKRLVCSVVMSRNMSTCYNMSVLEIWQCLFTISQHLYYIQIKWPRKRFPPNICMDTRPHVHKEKLALSVYHSFSSAINRYLSWCAGILLHANCFPCSVTCFSALTQLTMWERDCQYQTWSTFYKILQSNNWFVIWAFHQSYRFSV
jgi:hypothetical protein